MPTYDTHIFVTIPHLDSSAEPSGPWPNVAPTAYTDRGGPRDGAMLACFSSIGLRGKVTTSPHRDKLLPAGPP